MVKKGVPTCVEGALEFRNVLNIKVWQKFWDVSLSGTERQPPPKFFEGALEWEEPQIFQFTPPPPPPQPDTTWHGPGCFEAHIVCRIVFHLFRSKVLYIYVTFCQGLSERGHKITSSSRKKADLECSISGLSSYWTLSL
jgi:hypothetical protein